MAVDTTRTIEIENAPAKMLRLVGLGVLMTGVSVALAFRWIPDIGPGSYGEFIGYCGLVFFGVCTVVVLWRLLTTRGPVVTIAPDGIRDRRLTSDLIPWTAIRAISTWEYRGQKAMVLAVDPSTEARLALTRMARWTRGANRALGADGLCVTAQGLKIDYVNLMALSLDYWKRAKSTSAASGTPVGI